MGGIGINIHIRVNIMLESLQDIFAILLISKLIVVPKSNAPGARRAC